MRLLAVIAAVLLAACSSAPVQPPKPDPVKKAWYGQTVEQLATLNRDAEGLLQGGKADEAAALITQGQPIMSRLLSVPQPTLPAVEAASDLDHLYGRMLLANRHYGWARLQFQKNLARWRNWQTQTPDVIRRRKLAETSIAECDRHL